MNEVRLEEFRILSGSFFSLFSGLLVFKGDFKIQVFIAVSEGSSLKLVDWSHKTAIIFADTENIYFRFARCVELKIYLLRDKIN